MKYILVTCLFFSGCAKTGDEIMTQDEMENFVVGQAEVINQQKGHVEFTYKNVKMALISDVKHDRMRIISAIAKYSTLSAEMKDAVMESNFHLAIDARYAVLDDVLYTAYIHPLSPLTEQELESALNQVSSLALTFGTTYTSGMLRFNSQAVNRGNLE